MNAAASCDWSCPYCETRDPECHRSDCEGFTPDPKEIERLTGKGKYRETLPFWVRVGSALWLERKEMPFTNLSQS